MEVLLSKVTQQAMNYAIRSGIAITSGYAVQQCGRLLKSTKGKEKSELASLQLRLESKIKIISPAIDMIELIAARGNTTLESAVTLTRSLRAEIQALGVRIAKAVNDEDRIRRNGGIRSEAAEVETKNIIADIRLLLERIEDAVPLINLAITTSGANLSTSLPPTVSPSRLLQASTLLTSGDTRYAMSSDHAVQVCPDFVVSAYMLFSSHAPVQGQENKRTRETSWKEVMHKAHLKLLRVPLNRIYNYPTDDGGPTRRPDHESDDSSQPKSFYIPGQDRVYEYAYQLLLIEDLDDDRVHTFEDEDVQPQPYEGVGRAGIRELIPVHEVSKIFYADTGKILNIGTEDETNHPVLLLKRDVNAIPPRRDVPQPPPDPEEEEQSELDDQLFRESTPTPGPDSGPTSPTTGPHPLRLPHDLDLEWIALEVYSEAEDDSESENEEDPDPSTLNAPKTSTSRQSTRSPSTGPSLTTAFSRFNIRSPPPTTPSTPPTPSSQQTQTPDGETQVILSPTKKTQTQTQTPFSTSSTTRSNIAPLPSMQTSLSLLEMLVRLTALQQFRQESHLAISDELLTFFLSEAATVGAGGDAELRKRVRSMTRQRVGFDPYDESPIKRRGEEYLSGHIGHGGGSVYEGEGEGEGEYYEDEGDYEGEGDYDPENRQYDTSGYSYTNSPGSEGGGRRKIYHQDDQGRQFSSGSGRRRWRYTTPSSPDTSTTTSSTQYRASPSPLLRKVAGYPGGPNMARHRMPPHLASSQSRSHERRSSSHRGGEGGGGRLKTPPEKHQSEGDDTTLDPSSG